MQQDNNRKKYNIRFAISGLLIVCGGILFYYLLFHFDAMKERIGYFISVFAPVWSGIIIAYILNPVTRSLEKKMAFPLWNRIKKKKDHVYSKEAFVIRIICVVITIVIFIALIYGLIMTVVPQIIKNIRDIISVDNQFDFYEVFNEVLSFDPRILENMSNLSENLFSNITLVLQSVRPYLDDIKNTTFTLIDYASPVFKSLMNFLIGLIISIYLLIDKEKYIAQSKKMLYAFFKRERANNFINNLRYSDKIFGGFITGKIVDSMIIGVMCYIGMLVIGSEYSVLIAVVIGVTNVIPYFGPFIGAIPCGLLMLMEDPKKALIFIIFIIVLQQFDGNILGPKILGSSIGLNGFWVIFAITVFSKLFGVIGMFMGVPIFAVVYAAIRTLVNQRLEIKHMPVDTQFYIDSDYIPESDGINNTGKSFRFAKKTFDRVTRETYQEDEGTNKNEIKITENKVENAVSDTGSEVGKG